MKPALLTAAFTSRSLFSLERANTGVHKGEMLGLE